MSVQPSGESGYTAYALILQRHSASGIPVHASEPCHKDINCSTVYSQVPLDKPMMPAGNVELWLGEVERRMKASVRTQIVAAMHAYPTRPRPQWVREWPAMVVLAVTQIFWARGVEETVAAGNVQAYLERCTSDLMDLTDLVQGQLTNAERLTLGALITMDVHARDVVQELVDAGLQRVTDFEWVSRLRYYWRDDILVDMAQVYRAYKWQQLDPLSS
eukprot:GHRR01037192.1.p1 GENE.GHRR01037192.1~~GHRR01037192.1.p1  ORF type:complete len:217 (+),score=61.07 GHRR01037192.1:316-966(+)